MAKVVEEEGTDLVIVGKQSIDGDYGQTAQMLATQLDWAQGTSLYSVRKMCRFTAGSHCTPLFVAARFEPTVGQSNFSFRTS